MASHHGVVYTKQWVVDLILNIAGYTEDKPLHAQRICEPSCGEGAFLTSIVKRLVFAARREGACALDSLGDCICAFDTDEAAVEHSKKLVLNELIALGVEKSIAQLLVKQWIKQADFVLETPDLYDYVVGNPPYLRATEIDPIVRDLYCNEVSSMTRGCDLFIAFIQKGIDQLKEGGNLAYICADRWLQNKYGEKLRCYLADHKFSIDCLVRMHGVNAFDSEVDAYPAITKISKSGGDISYVDCNSSFNKFSAKDLQRWLMSPEENIQTSTFTASRIEQIKDGSVLPLSTPSRVQLVRHLVEKYPTLENSGVSLGIGIATGNDKVFIVDNPEIVERERLLPVFNMRDYRRRVKKEKWLVNPWTDSNTLIDLDEFPKTRDYLELHRADLSKRYVALKGDWYRTIDKPNRSIFGKPMLLFPDLATSSDPVYSDGTKYPCHNCYWLTSDRWDLNVLGGLLMSEVAETFIEALCVKMRGGTMRFQAQYLRLIHVPEYDSIDDEIKFMLSKSFSKKDREGASIAARLAYGLES